MSELTRGVTAGDVVASAAEAVGRTARQNRPWIERLARVGFVAQALVYLMIGWLALRAAMEARDVRADAAGALGALNAQQYGALALVVIAIGSFGFALWQSIAAITDAGNEGTSARGIVHRVGRAVSSVLYLMLGAAAFRMLRGSGHSAQGGDAVRNSTVQIMRAPAGRWLIGLVGVIVLAYAAHEFYSAYHAKMIDRLDLSSLSPRGRDVATQLGRTGIAAHGVVLALVGWFVFRAAIDNNGWHAGGPAAAIRAIAVNQGARAMGVVAVGLLAYGLFQLVQARYRRVELP
ncbi:MAG: DUF1206 domain-containing protein [Gemmatimonadaceae bacterium]